MNVETIKIPEEISVGQLRDYLDDSEKSMGIVVNDVMVSIAGGIVRKYNSQISGWTLTVKKIGILSLMLSQWPKQTEKGSIDKESIALSLLQLFALPRDVLESIIVNLVKGTLTRVKA